MNFLERRDSKRHCCEVAIAGKGGGKSDGEKVAASSSQEALVWPLGTRRTIEIRNAISPTQR